MYGLALSGGGAKGSYQIGVWKALRELGIEIDAVTGTSVGALNGALFVQDLYDQAYDMWCKITPNQVIETDNTLFSEIIKLNLNPNNLEQYISYFEEVLKNRGLNIDPLRKLIEHVLDEDLIRKSTIDYGLVTVSLTDRRPLELFKEDIPEGKLADYLMASSFLPTFKQIELDGKRFIDGGFYDNMPINLLLKKKVDHIIAVEMHAIGNRRRIRNKDVEIIYIQPSGELGNILEFDPERAKKNIKMGYLDTLKVFGEFQGINYYLKNAPIEQEILDFFMHMRVEDIQQLQRYLKIKGTVVHKRLLLERILPQIGKLFDLEKEEGYEKLFFRILEYVADKEAIERLEAYEYEVFIRRVSKKYEIKKIITYSTKILPSIQELWENLKGDLLRDAIAQKVITAYILKNQ